MQHSNQQKLFWYFCSLLSLTVIGVLYYAGLIDQLVFYDKTFISVGIIGFYFVVTIILGIKIFFKLAFDIENYWFMSQLLMRAGLTGTLIGIMIMMITVLGGETVSAENLTNIMTNLLFGVGTAILTTLAGLVACSFLQVQLMIIRVKNK